jgi:hypothetical protein
MLSGIRRHHVNRPLVQRDYLSSIQEQFGPSTSHRSE